MSRLKAGEALSFGRDRRGPDGSGADGVGGFRRPRRGDSDAGLSRDILRQFVSDIDEKLVHHMGTDLLVLDLIELEGERLGDVVLLPIGHAVPE